MNVVDKKDNKEILKKWFIHTILWFFAMISIITVFKCFVQINFIPSESMEPLLKKGDIVICMRYEVKSIKRYDVVTFNAPDNSKQIYIKRVIGLPGDEILVKDGTVSVNGLKIKDDFVKSMKDTSGDGVYIVPKNKYFVMGDNRDNSFDSRFWEDHYVSKQDMKAVAKAKIYPFSRIKKIV